MESWETARKAKFDEKWEYSLFSVRDLKDASGLITTLRDSKDQLSQYLRDQFSPDFQKELKAYNTSHVAPQMLQQALVEELNQLLKGKLLHTQKRFAQVVLNADTNELLAQKPRGADLIRLNRFLLADAYPKQLAKNPIFKFADGGAL